MNKSHAYKKIKNNAVRLVMKKSERDHITLLLKELHWLPVKYRIQYKIATLAFRHFDGILPPYLSFLSSPTNHHAPSVLQQKDCSKFQAKISKLLESIRSGTLLRLSETHCQPT